MAVACTSKKPHNIEGAPCGTGKGVSGKPADQNASLPAAAYVRTSSRDPYASNNGGTNMHTTLAVYRQHVYVPYDRGIGRLGLEYPLGRGIRTRALTASPRA